VKISFRRWELADIEHVRRILLDTWLETYSSFIPHDDILGYLDEHYDHETIKSLVEDPDVVGFVAEVDGAIAGYERTFYNKEEKRLYVQQLYILPKYQGLGFGKQLMAFAAEHAKTYDLDRVWLGVMVENTYALLWYQKMGYQIVEKEPFTMGKTIVEHYIGYVPVNRMISS
jgi:ribosomal protein S18 acetylase RimI-like enzyme